MASLTIRKLDDPLKTRLRIQAARHGHSMEAEAREILRAALDREPATPRNLADAIHERFAKYGGVDLELLPRDELVRDPPTFD
jgi:plasmid stability protein